MTQAGNSTLARLERMLGAVMRPGRFGFARSADQAALSRELFCDHPRNRALRRTGDHPLRVIAPQVPFLDLVLLLLGRLVKYLSKDFAEVARAPPSCGTLGRAWQRPVLARAIPALREAPVPKV